MIDSAGLFGEFCDALNAELAAIGCRLRVDRHRAGSGDTILLVDGVGNELGWLPEHIDAASIAAFEIILDSGQSHHRAFG